MVSTVKPTASGSMKKSKDEVLAECATVSVTVDTPVIIYCFKGFRTSNRFLALKKACIKNVRVYFGPGMSGHGAKVYR